MRATTKYISKENLEHNLQTLISLAPRSKCVAVVKANAYGCEAPMILDAFEQADLLAVAEIGEALTLRQAGSKKAILLLEGVFEENELNIAAQNNFEPVIGSKQQLEWLLSHKNTFTRIWFKLDSGMGRLGFQKHNADHAMQKISQKYDEKNIVIMTHFSDSDAADRSITLQQIENFDAFASKYPQCQQSLCNSAGVLAYPDAHRDYIRPGIALYGASPFATDFAEDHYLKPVMTLKTRVLSIKHFKKGDPIGYGQTYRMENDGNIAICEIGYADGYSRFIPSGSPIIINNQEYLIVGRVAMDMISVLVDDNVGVGDEVICWGEGLPIERICEAANTIPHQLFTTVTERP
ncbi:MAG: alanine racemase, partial [Gammaproteobacteria bacterium]|nr:alanine racemase [Gammaproteobacteria bacterium]